MKRLSIDILLIICVFFSVLLHYIYKLLIIVDDNVRDYHNNQQNRTI